MELDRDFSEFIGSCARSDVRFLIVGRYAVAAHGRPRFTKDLHVWIAVGESTASRVVAPLEELGFGSLGLREADFVEEGSVVQLGYPPKGIDTLTGADGVDFDACWERRVKVRIGHQVVPFIAVDDLIRTRKHLGAHKALWMSLC